MNFEDEIDAKKILSTMAKFMGKLNEGIIETDEFNNFEINQKIVIVLNSIMSKDIENSEVLQEITTLLTEKKDKENCNEDDVELTKSILNFMKQTNLFYKDVLKKLKGE